MPPFRQPDVADTFILWRTHILEVFNSLLRGEFAHHADILIRLRISRIDKAVRDHNKTLHIPDFSSGRVFSG